MADKIQLADALAESGHRFAPTALAMPRELIHESVRYMDEIKPLRGKYTRGTYKANGHYKPYKTDWNPGDPGQIIARTLETFQCQVEEEFDPSSVLTTVYSKPLEAIDHIGMDIVKLIAVEEMRKASEDLNECIWQGVRDGNGTTSLSNFDGFATIIRKERAAGNISVANGNYFQIGGLTKYNCGDKLKALWKRRNSKIKRAEMFVEQAILDLYNEWYAAKNFNNANTDTDGTQKFLYGTEKKCKLVSCPGMEGMGYIIITDGKSNLMFGSEGIGAGEDATAPFIIRHGNNVKTCQLYTEAWLGVEFAHIEKEFLMVASYNINDDDVYAAVSEEDITITTTANTSKTATVNFKGFNLTSATAVTINGTGLTVSADTITAEAANAADGIDLTITFDGSEAVEGVLRFTNATDDIDFTVNVKGVVAD